MNLTGYNTVRPPFPKDCVIKNIRCGTESRGNNVYAELYDGTGTLLIAATLDYINEQYLLSSTPKRNVK